MSTISIKSLLEAGVHFGHQKRKWNPKMSKYIFGQRNDIHIIDLQKTVKELKKAYKFIRDTVATGGKVLFVGTKKQAQEFIKQEAIRCEMPYVNQRWLGGMLTNFETIKRNIHRLKELEKMSEEGILKKLPKKESARMNKEMDSFRKVLDGVKSMNNLPNVLFLVDPVYEVTAVLEAKRLEIPVVAVCDTDSDPDKVDYVIPGNDDAIRAIKLFVSIVADAVIEGREILQKEKEVSEIPIISDESFGSEELVSKEEVIGGEIKNE